ncbi:MAG: patatin-like phospholipase family protein [Chthoniobacterales bacterium]
MTWQEFLTDTAQGCYKPLFDAAFFARWGSEPWEPTPDDRRAAGKLHTQIASRITTQRLGYLDGVEKTALESVYALFQKTRDIADQQPDCRHFDAIAWDVLNRHVRPFTAKWHRASENGALAGLDATDQFRAELSALQQVLVCFDLLLIHLRDGRAAAGAAEARGTERKEKIVGEMDEELRWGIPLRTGGIAADPQSKVHPAAAINAAEREAITARRQHYSIDPKKPHAIGLALSGGGIRSATFSLGVLVALAGRGLLPKFDYLSTVSGGGYLGSFLSAFLTSSVEPAEAPIGLQPKDLPFRREEGEAAALRHLRHHSKYLAGSSLWGRLKMMCAQLYGMLLNGVAIAWMALLAGLLERVIRSSPWFAGWWEPLLWFAITVWALGVIAALVALRFWTKLQRHADGLVTLPTLLLLALLTWKGLDYTHQWFDRFSGAKPDVSWLWQAKTWLAIIGAVPLITSALAGVLGDVMKRLGAVLIFLTAIAAPLFFFGIYLFIYRWICPAADVLASGHLAAGVELLPWGILVLGGLIYFVLLDINFTSPHRHYRDRLAEAYLIRPAKEPRAEQPFDNAIRLPLSSLGAQAKKAPYHLLNCALNVPGSTDPRMQGRLADFFLFSPRYSGSPLTSYQPTEDWEKADAHLDLGTAMAISGAAAGPQMGLGTLRRFSFWLALLNVRLGYWVRKPGQRALLSGGAPGLWFLLKEMLGTMNENSAWLNVSDGGHIENLGVYELLRRRCKYIVAIDGEQDPKMTFHALTTLQRLAFIDLGIKIDAELDDLRLNERGLSRSHFRFCRIRYPKDERGSEEVYGYLLYLKLSLTGNEGEFLRRYRLDEPVFPHHSTADQFFSETQFEAYRSLGEHVGNKLFLRALVGKELADGKSIEVEDWFNALGENLLDPLPAR